MGVSEKSVKFFGYTFDAAQVRELATDEDLMVPLLTLAALIGGL